MSLGIGETSLVFGLKSNLDFMDEVISPWFWYQLNETSGTAVTSESGNVADLTAVGTTANIWDNPGEYTPPSSNTDTRIGGSADTDLGAIIDLAGSDWEQMLIGFGFRYGLAGLVTANEGILTYGHNASNGGLVVYINAADQLAIQIRVGTSTQTYTFSGWQAATELAIDDKHGIVIELVRSTGAANLYADGDSTPKVSISGLSFPTTESVVQELTVGARRTSGATYDMYLNAEVGGLTRLSDLHVMRRSSRDSSLAGLLSGDLMNNPNVFPLSLVGK